MPRGAKIAFRLAAVVLLAFTAGHTAGFLSFRPQPGAGLAVLESMHNIHFDFGGSDSTWWNLYKGFGLFVSIYLLFSAIAAWRLTMRVTDAALASSLAWLLCLTQLGNVALCLAYFGPLQAAFAAVCTGCLGWAAIASSPRNWQRQE